MRQRIVYICVFFVLLALLIGVFFQYKLDDKLKDSKVLNYVTSITAIIGAIGLIFQQSRGQELNSSQYLSNLSHEYFKEEGFQELLNEMEDDKALNDADMVIACKCLDFFEPFYLLQKANTFAMKQMDDLFCFRFFSLINNNQIQEHELLKHCEYYANIGKLYKKWRQYRIWRKKPIPFAKNDLNNKPWFNDLCAGRPAKLDMGRKPDYSETKMEKPDNVDMKAKIQLTTTEKRQELIIQNGAQTNIQLSEKKKNASPPSQKGKKHE